MTAQEATGCSQTKLWSLWDSPKLQGLSALDLRQDIHSIIAVERERGDKLSFKCPVPCVMGLLHLDSVLADSAGDR